MAADSNNKLRRWLIAGAGLGLACGVLAYGFTASRLSAARLARMADDYTRSEKLLTICLRLPGLRSAIEWEEELTAVQQGDLRNEKVWRSRLVSRPKDRTEILQALAKGKLATFQWAEATKDADAILSRQPNNAPALWIRGRAEVEMQQEDRARRDFEKALEVEPEAFDIRLSLAELLHKQGYVLQAIEQFQRLLQQQPSHPLALLNLAHCWQDQAQLTEAGKLLDVLLAAHPDSVAGLVERGRLELRAGQPEVAERWLRQAMQLEADNADASFVLRLALQAQDKIDQDLEHEVEQHERRQAELKTWLHEGVRKPEVLTEIGTWMMRTGTETEVSGWFYSALREDANYKPAHAGLATYYSQSGQPLRAQMHAQQAGIQLEHQAVPNNASMLTDRGASAPLGSAGVLEVASRKEVESQEVHRLCSACHAYPAAETMPRAAWRKEVKQGYDFLRASNLAGDYPPLESVVEYYERGAPEQLPAIAPLVAHDAGAIQFEKRGTGYVPRVPPQPGVTNANLVQLLGKPRQELLLCETRLDALMLLKPYESEPGGTVIPQVSAPCHTTVCDLDLDGQQDILVASLGSFFPTDDKVGQVLWLRGKSAGQFDAVPLVKGVGRVSDVQVADFNADGRLDLVIAVFGWRTTGEILYLENRTTDWLQPDFTPHVVDARHGAIHVPVKDLNGDGRPDFVALISQQHETIVAYLNQGDGTFQPATIFAAPHPSFGCSGIEVVDMEGDGDLDVLLTNGDILDPPYLLKPYHGVQWLENEGVFPYTQHVLAAMYGVARAVAADFDGDGDQDVAAVTFLPAALFPQREQQQLPAVVLFEQNSKQDFSVSVLESGTCDHFSCAAGDWDDDGKVDLVVTNYSWSGSRPMVDAAQLWRNMGKRNLGKQ